MSDDEKKLPYMKKGKTDCWPFKGARDQAPNREAKMACGIPWCCNPRHVVEQGDPKPGKTSTSQQTDERDQLCAELDKRGISYRTNASTEKLRELLHQADGDAKGAAL